MSDDTWPAKGTLHHRVLAWIRERKTAVKSAEVAEKFDVEKPRACTVLKQLTDAELIVREGTRCKYTYQAAA